MIHSLYVFEGVDGTGKTSLAKSFAKKINGEYYKGIPKIFRPLKNFVDRKLPPQIRYKFYLLGNKIMYRELKSLLKDKNVVVDQYVYCTVAFHTVSLNKKLKNPAPPITPKIIFYLTAPWNEIDRRLNERGKRKQLEELAYLQKVDKIYKQLFRSLSNVIYFNSESRNIEENTKLLITEVNNHQTNQTLI